MSGGARPSTESAEAVEESATGWFATAAFSSWLASGIPLYACLAKPQVDVGSTLLMSFAAFLVSSSIATPEIFNLHVIASASATTTHRSESAIWSRFLGGLAWHLDSTFKVIARKEGALQSMGPR